MVSSSIRKKTAVVAPQRFMPATTSLTTGAIAAMRQDFDKMCRKYWHRLLDLCEELSYALAFYQEWQRRHKY